MLLLPTPNERPSVPQIEQEPCTCEVDGKCVPCRRQASQRLIAIGQYDPYQEAR